MLRVLEPRARLSADQLRTTTHLIARLWHRILVVCHLTNRLYQCVVCCVLVWIYGAEDVRPRFSFVRAAIQCGGRSIFGQKEGVARVARKPPGPFTITFGHNACLSLVFHTCSCTRVCYVREDEFDSLQLSFYKSTRSRYGVFLFGLS